MIGSHACSPPLVRNVPCRLVQAAAPACSRESVPAPSTQHRLEACAAASPATRQRPDAAGLDDPALAESARCDACRSTRDHSSMAPRGLQGVLALEIPKQGGAAKDRSRSARSHPANEQGKPKMGSIPDPWRTADTLERDRAARECLDRILIFGEAHLRQIIMRYARTWPWVKTRPWVGRSSGPVPSLPSRSCPACITTTSGYDFRKRTGGVAGCARGQHPALPVIGFRCATVNLFYCCPLCVYN
jgi:hypothetical protein